MDGAAVAVAPSGAVIATGTYTGSIDFGPAGALPTNNVQTAFVASLAPDGTPVWARWFVGDGPQESASVVADAKEEARVDGDPGLGAVLEPVRLASQRRDGDHLAEH